MRFETTSYPLDCPTPVWVGLKGVQAADRNINDEVVYSIASRVDHVHRSPQPVDLDEETIAAIEAIVNEGDGNERDS